MHNFEPTVEGGRQIVYRFIHRVGELVSRVVFVVCEAGAEIVTVRHDEFVGANFWECRYP